MSKYNLVDIFEGFKDDLSPEEKERFDMLTQDDQDKLEKIKKMMDTEKSGIKEGDAVDLAIEVSQEKAGIKEVRIDNEVAERIEGLMNIQLKKQFLDVFEDLWLDLIEEDPFYAEDVIAHLSNEMSKQISNRQAQGDKLAGIEETKPGYNEDGTPKSNDEMGDDEREDFYNDLDSVDEASSPKVDFIRALKVDANGTELEIKSYLESLKRSGDEFDSIDDYVEDFKNYVADKSLQEHFGRFMKDYQ